MRTGCIRRMTVELLEIQCKEDRVEEIDQKGEQQQQNPLNDGK